jgi:hypothetical protein
MNSGKAVTRTRTPTRFNQNNLAPRMANRESTMHKVKVVTPTREKYGKDQSINSPMFF